MTRQQWKLGLRCGRCRVVPGIVVALVSLHPGSLFSAPFEDELVQAPSLKEPERGSVVGALAKLAFGAEGLSRGAFNLQTPFAAPTDRGPLQADVFPSYSVEGGIGEFGLGWQTDLTIRRMRVSGDLDYATDEFTSPWGRLALGDDGAYYPLGLRTQIKVRLYAYGWMAATGDGTTYAFDARDALVTSRGIYAWSLTEVRHLNGDRTSLAYDTNASGRRFLRYVRYGGRNGVPQHEIEFIYELLPEKMGRVRRAFADYRSGQEVVLDRRVSRIVARSRVAGSGTFAMRWQYSLAYQDFEDRPAFYLRYVTKTYASGESEPPVEYSYDTGSSYLQNATFSRIDTLDSYLADTYGTGILPSHSSVLDMEQDGLIDLEHSARNLLVRQTASDWVYEPLGPEPPGVNRLCRLLPDERNPARHLARMTPNAAAPQVVATRFDAISRTEVVICDRSGVPHEHGQLVVPGRWDLGPNTRLVDLNHDHRPEIVRIDHGGYQVLENRSIEGATPGETRYDFVVQPRQSWWPAFLPIASWLHDVNGDGQQDVVAKHSAGLCVWYGLGNFRFSSNCKNMVLRVDALSTVIDLDTYELSFDDLNRDGLADVLITRGRAIHLFLNDLNEFRFVAVPALSNLGWEVTYPLIADLSGSGETQAVVVYLVPGEGFGAFSFAFTQPGTGLLRSVYDGKGTRVDFVYSRASPYPGITSRAVVLSELTVTASGEEPVRYQYTYDAPVQHSIGKFFVGFGETERFAPFLSELVQFYHDDEVSGIVLSSSATDDRAALEKFSLRSYDERFFHGIRWQRPDTVLEGVRDTWTSTGPLKTTVYEAYAREICPTRVKTTTFAGDLLSISELALIPRLEAELQCLSRTRRIEGRHGSGVTDVRDFTYAAEIERNDIGQPTKIWSIAGTDRLLLQEITYDELYRIQDIAKPGQGHTSAIYDGETGLLVQVRAPDGVVVRTEQRDPTTDSVLELRTDRRLGSEPEGLFSQFYRYDGFERLWKAWDSFGEATESLPVEALRYAYATSNKPARIHVSELVDAAAQQTRLTVELLTAGGDALAGLRLIPEGWAVGNVSWRDRAEREERRHYRSAFRAEQDVEALTHSDLLSGSDLLGVSRMSGLEYAISDQSVVQTGVNRALATTYSLSSGALVAVQSENGEFVTERATDLDGNLLWYKDELANVTQFEYDALGRLVRVLLPDDALHSVQYDAHGRKEYVHRAKVGTLHYSYDRETGLPASQEVLTVSGVPVRSVAWFRDAIGRVASELHTAAETGETRELTFHYDGMIAGSASIAGQRGHLSHVSGDGFERAWIYNPDGSKRQEVTRLHVGRIAYMVDTLIGAVYPISTPVTYEVTQHWGYYEDGSIRDLTHVVSDDAGRIHYGLTQSFTYDHYGRMSAIELDGSRLASLRYDAEGKLTHVDWAAGGSIEHSYDGVTRRPSGYSQNGGGWTGGVSWSLNDRGRIDSETSRFKTGTWHRQYQYDERGFLWKSGDAAESAEYAYTAAGLPKSIRDFKGARDVERRAQTITAGSVVYEYDDAGRVAVKGGLQLGYGPTGQLEEARLGAASWRYVYDHEGQRLAKSKAGVMQAAYVGGGYLDQERFILPLRVANRVVGVFVVSGGGNRFEVLHTDPRGTMLAHGGMSNRPTPFGLRAAYGELSPAIDYVEKGFDATLGTVRFGVRDYDPLIGQWVSPDPLFLESPAEGFKRPLELNLYGYAGNNPVNLVDPDGTCAVTANGSVDCVSGIQEARAGLLQIMNEAASEGRYGTAVTAAVLHVMSDVNLAFGYAAQLTLAGAYNAGHDTGAGFVEGDYDRTLRGSTGLLALGVGGKLVSPSPAAAPAAEVVGRAGARNIDDLVTAAQKQFPGKAGRIEQHHITPKYLGGDPKGPTVPIDAAYHQQITNAFRELHPYSKPSPTSAELQRIMQQVYERFPLPGQ